MSKTLKIGMGGLVVAILLSAFMVGAAFAQDDTTTSTQAPPDFMGRGHKMGGHSMLGEAGLQAVADALGMTTDELSAELWGGRTLAELADTAGVDLLTLQQAVQDANAQAQRDAIEQAVEDGTLSREQADWMLEGLDNGYFDGLRSFGRGFDRIGGRSFGSTGYSGMSGRLQAAPSAPSVTL